MLTLLWGPLLRSGTVTWKGYSHAGGSQPHRKWDRQATGHFLSDILCLKGKWNRASIDLGLKPYDLGLHMTPPRLWQVIPLSIEAAYLL